MIVRLEDSAGWLHVSVIDHGCGFDTEQPEIKGSGCGLVGMQERASVIGARLAMESDEHGTKMTLVAPMHVAEGRRRAHDQSNAGGRPRSGTRGFRMILEQDPDVRVVAEAADGAQAYAIVAREKPDILLMDISMPPGQSGLVACEKIAKDFPGTKVVILTMFAEPEYLFYTLRGGAAGYVLKNSTSEELIAAVHAVAEGGSYIHPKMTAMLTKQLVAGGEEEDRSYQQLSNRELEIPPRFWPRASRTRRYPSEIFLSGQDGGGPPFEDIPEAGPETRADLVDYASGTSC